MESCDDQHNGSRIHTMKRVLVFLGVFGLVGVIVYVRLGEPEVVQPDKEAPIEEVDPNAKFETPTQSLAHAWLGQDEVECWEQPFVLSQLAAAIYDGEAAFTRKATALGFDQASIVWVSADHLQAAVVSSNQEPSITVAVFRGTSTFGELIDDLQSIDRPLGDWQVHQGFLLALSGVEGKVRQAVSERDSKHLWATGHSLGGAMAGLFVARRLESGETLPRLVTFGQPAFGNRAFVDACNSSLGSNYARFVFEDDPVTRLAPGYAHAGRVIRARKGRVVYRTGSGEAMSQEPVQLYDSSVDAQSDPIFSEADLERFQSGDLTIAEPHQVGHPPVYGSNPSFLLNVGDHKMENYVKFIRQQRPLEK